jgi:hypothetical protein
VTFIASWSRQHRAGKNAMVRRRDWGDFTLLVDYKPVDGPGQGHSIFEDAKRAADAASGCSQPCSCPPWDGPAEVLHAVGDQLSLICHLCHTPLTVTVGPSFVGSVGRGEAPPQDADHAGYTLRCECGEEYNWLYWSMPRRMGREREG